MNFDLANVFCAAVGCGVLLAALHDSPARGADVPPFVTGADVSMLPELEKLGATYRHADGRPADAIAVLRDGGCNLFRLRLFVDPNPSFTANWGATQGLDQVRALAKRVKASGAAFLLDIHYSDTWADPLHQNTPAAWRSLDAAALEQKVFDYTTDVLKAFEADGTLPQMVQVGNEVTPGMLWPIGKVLEAPKDREQAQWAQFARLFDAGARAVRQFKGADGKPVRVVLHIHGGGRPGLPKWFFETFNRHSSGYDVTGLSFYPSYGDSLDALRQNLRDLSALSDKDVLIAEVGYPSRAITESFPSMRWPMTPEGQAQFFGDFLAVLKSPDAPRCLGFVWWYPEARPIEGSSVYRNGAEGLFDESGKALPALAAFGPAQKK